MIDSIMDIMENNISSIPLSVKPVERTNQYHEEIYVALWNRDAPGAQDLMLKHIQEIQNALDSPPSNDENSQPTPLPLDGGG